MLNEVWQLTMALKDADVSFENIADPQIRDFSNGKGGIIFRNSLDPNVPMEIVSFGKDLKTWEYSPHNHLRFPIAKLCGPLLRSDNLTEEQRAALWGAHTDSKAIREVLKELIRGEWIIEDQKTAENFWKIWYGQPAKIAKMLLPFLPENTPLTQFLKHRSEAGTFSKESARKMILGVCEALMVANQQGTVDLALIRNLMIGKMSKSKSKSEEIWCLHDLQDSSILTSDTRRVFQDSLREYNRVHKKPSSIEEEAICAISGEPGPLVTGTFTQVHLPVFTQKTALMAMNKDIPCHTRYGQIAATICPIGIHADKQMAQALIMITDLSYQGHTWMPVPSGRRSGNRDQQDLLIVYVTTAPLKKVNIAEQLAAYGIPDEEADSSEFTDNTSVAIQSYAESIRTVSKALQGKDPLYRDPNLCCMLLREIDPGRRQIIYADRFTVQELFDAAERWEKGYQNIPNIEMWYSPKEKLPAIRHCAGSITLLDVVKLYQTAWTRDGRKNDTTGISFADVMTLFLNRSGSRYRLEEMTGKILKNLENILISAGAECHGQKRIHTTLQKRTVLTAVAFLGILLHQSDITKENYMKEKAYNLGRLLSFADKLHVLYCQNVRDGDIPNVLVGNALIPVVCNHPASGLGRRLDRLRIYLAWAKKTYESKSSEKECKDSKLIRWCYLEMAKVTKMIDLASLSDTPLSDVEKTCLLLGYLAPYEKRHSVSEPEQADIVSE